MENFLFQPIKYKFRKKNWVFNSFNQFKYNLIMKLFHENKILSKNILYFKYLKNFFKNI